MSITHDDMDSFKEAGYEDDDWLAARPRDEDDESGPDGDEWRPVGLIGVETMPFPLRCAEANAALKSDTDLGHV